MVGKQYRDWQQYSGWQTVQDWQLYSGWQLVQALAVLKWMADSVGDGSSTVGCRQFRGWKQYSGLQTV